MLHAAGWSAELQPDGGLAHLALDGVEVLRGLRVVVRDDAWGTVPGRTRWELAHGDGELVVTVDSEHRMGPGSVLTWTAVLSIGTRGVVAAIEGTARGDVLTNRIGLVVLHPLALSGTPVEVRHPDGTVEPAAFPDEVSPHQPFRAVAGLGYRMADGRRLDLAFAGDVFETEDQRNWSDASYKTYSRPLDLPFPYRVADGETVRQEVRLTVSGERTEPLALPSRPGRPRPRLGVTHGPDDAGVPSPALDHLRVDVGLDPDGLRGAEVLAARADHPIQLVLHVVAGADAAAARLADALDAAGTRLDTVVVHDRDAPTTTPASVDLVRGALGHRLTGVPVLGGTDDNLAELLRTPPPGDLDGVVFALTPQVHDEADLAVIETVEALPAMIATARRRHADVSIGSLTLRPRRNIYREGVVIDRLARDESAVDARQAEPFAAAWLLATLAVLAEAGVHRITVGELGGPRGLRGTPAGAVFAALHDARQWGPSIVDAHLGLAAVALDGPGGRGLAVAELHGRRRRVRVAGVDLDLAPYETAFPTLEDPA
jgi:hypothetical protein